MLEWNVVAMGLVIFFARLCDVSIGTIRTLVTVQGRTMFAFILAIFEITIWISVVSTVIHQIKEKPLLIVFYAFGYATGNALGIIVEQKLAFGLIILRVITRRAGPAIADYLRQQGQPVTTFTGEGMKGPIEELYIVCRRKDLQWILPEVKNQDQSAFYVVEQARDVSKVLKPSFTALGGWCSIGKRK
jgi:uncharacterized protein YebE (UPF0316 family)